MLLRPRSRVEWLREFTPEEVALAQLLCEWVAGLERLRFSNSGTDPS